MEPSAAMETDGAGQSTEESDLLRRSADKWKEFTSQPNTGQSAWLLQGGADLLKDSKRHSFYYTGEGEDEGDIADFIKIAEAWRGTATDDDPIEIPVEECIDLWMPWRRAVIVKVLGRTVSYRILHQRLTSMWCSSGGLDIVDLQSEYYVVRFAIKEDYERALMQGPWLIQGHYLTVMKWRPFFQPSKQKILSTLVWVRFPGVPHELFEKEDFLIQLAKRIGKPGKVDVVTCTSTRAKYVRICVEMNLHQVLRSKVVLNGNEFAVEYEGLSQICFECGKLGHKTQECPLNNPPVEYNAEQPNAAATLNKKATGPTPERPFGPWMIATNRRRRPTTGQRNNGGKQGGNISTEQQENTKRGETEHVTEERSRQDITSGSRFNVLYEEEEMVDLHDQAEIPDDLRNLQSGMREAARNFKEPSISLLSKDKSGNLERSGEVSNRKGSHTETGKRKEQASSEPTTPAQTKRTSPATGGTKNAGPPTKPLHDISNVRGNQQEHVLRTQGVEGQTPQNTPFIAAGDGHFKAKPPDQDSNYQGGKQQQKQGSNDGRTWMPRDKPPDKMDLQDSAVQNQS